MVNMNMIVNASDLVGYEAENKKSKENIGKNGMKVTGLDPLMQCQMLSWMT